VWAGACALVCRPFRHGTATVPGGATDLVALEQAPADQRRAIALAEILVARAAGDAGFTGMTFGTPTADAR
jgi:hypothetical protein